MAHYRAAWKFYGEPYTFHSGVLHTLDEVLEYVAEVQDPVAKEDVWIETAEWKRFEA